MYKPIVPRRAGDEPDLSKRLRDRGAYNAQARLACAELLCIELCQHHAASASRTATWLAATQPGVAAGSGMAKAIDHVRTRWLHCNARSTLASRLEVLKDYKDSWGLAYWFLSANGPLGGRRPKDVLATDPQSVLEAARREVEEIVHG